MRNVNKKCENKLSIIIENCGIFKKNSPLDDSLEYFISFPPPPPVT